MLITQKQLNISLLLESKSKTGLLFIAGSYVGKTVKSMAKRTVFYELL